MITGDTVIVWAIVVLALLAGHWFKWPGPLHYIPRYVFGVLCLDVPFSIWLLRQGYYDSEIWVALWGCAVFGGLAVAGAYGWDWALNNYCRAAAAEASDD